jgi:hypothetical protein
MSTINDYTESNSIILDLETLRVNYNNLLNQYRQAVTNYVTYLNLDISNSTYNSSPKPLEIVNGYVYSGTSTIRQINGSTVQECKASCSATSGCTGATFNNKNLGVGKTVTLSPAGAGSVVINPNTAGTLDNLAIGGTTPLAAHFTTLNASGLAAFAAAATGGGADHSGPRAADLAAQCRHRPIRPAFAGTG